MNISLSAIRSFRLSAHHLDAPAPLEDALSVAGVCGLQNTPPGGWKTALFNRLECCTPAQLHSLLYKDKTLLKAWSYRGVPVVFPTAEKDIFLTALQSHPGEEPWIYTRGISGALEHLQMPFDDLLQRTLTAVTFLDTQLVVSKNTLDQELARRVYHTLPADKKERWNAPSIYGNPDKQTMGQAAVSFLLRPCSFASLVIFGQRQGASPTFTSLKNWLPSLPPPIPEPEKKLVEKFLRAYGPATRAELAQWLGSSPKQARRLWKTVEEELCPITVDGQTRYILESHLPALNHAPVPEKRLVLLGPHDPYLDTRHRQVILPDTKRHSAVWRYVANPGVILRGGEIVGIWRSQLAGQKQNFQLSLWQKFSPKEKAELEELAYAHAHFRQRTVGTYTLET